MEADKTGVVVVDDEPDERLYLEDILRQAEQFCCTGSFSNGSDALHEIPHLHPRLVLMDINLPDINGIECTRKLKHLMPDVKIIIVSGLHEGCWIEKSLKAGADAYLVKPITPDQFYATLKYTVAGKTFHEGDHSTASAMVKMLTPREKEVMQHLADGLLYKEIADKLGISISAVHKYQHIIFQKLHISNRSEATRIWLTGQN
jgi:two-component system, NarL family, response regulator LiaR